MGIRRRALVLLISCAPLAFAGCAGSSADQSSTGLGPASAQDRSSSTPPVPSTDKIEVTTTAAAPSTTTDPVLEAISGGYVARCNDGNLSNNTDFRTTCSGGDGFKEWLAPYGECKDGDVIAMSSESKCSDHDGFSRLLPPDYQPERTPIDVARCNSGVFSDNTDFSATCTENAGVAEWLAPFGECNDGRMILMSHQADCGDHDGFRGLLAPDYEPVATPTDVARCTNGLFSDNTDFSTTCSDNGGVAEWLSPYGRCKDGTDVVMGPDASCSDHDGFSELLPTDYTPPPTRSARNYRCAASHRRLHHAACPGISRRHRRTGLHHRRERASRRRLRPGPLRVPQ